jgi:Putative Flp pilus-assembly TadE/G-like
VCELQRQYDEGTNQSSVGLHDEAGSALVFVAVTFAVLGVLLVGLARYAGSVVARAQARTAADAAALAGVSAGSEAARLLAERNGAVLLVLTNAGGVVRVTVQWGGVTMSATATLVPA